jgi:hypothetical protein
MAGTNALAYVAGMDVTKKKKFYVTDSRGQCYKTFYCGNLPPFHGNTIILCYKARLAWKLQRNCSKLTRYFNPRRSKIKITVVIYYSIVL